jgi:hypothetical protein
MDSLGLCNSGRRVRKLSVHGQPGDRITSLLPAALLEMLEKLPLGHAHLMSFELIPLAPLNPLRQLQGMTGNPP